MSDSITSNSDWTPDHTGLVLRDGDQVARHETGQVPEAGAAIALAVRDLSAPDGSFKNISFEVRAGEVFGFAGIIGAYLTVQFAGTGAGSRRSCRADC